MMIDLRELPKGETYSDQYGAWLEIFRQVAEEPAEEIHYPPSCWVPLLLYLGGKVRGESEHFREDSLVSGPYFTFQQARKIGFEREYVESICVLRPELVDALWKSDCQWKTVGRRHENKREFVVGSYSSFYRPEVLAYLELLERYEKPGYVKNCVVTSCSADKPYPAELHRRIAEVLPDDSWHQVIATGVLGVVPEELWSKMPLYDSGIPNKWRCQIGWEGYLAKVLYDRIVIYTEFYASSVFRACSQVVPSRMVECVLPVGGQDEYLDLAGERHIDRLREVVLQQPMKAIAKFLF